MTGIVFGVDLVLFFLIGLLGGAHCIGMCGPLVTMYAAKMDPARADGGHNHTNSRRQGHLSTFQVRQHLLFNLGRTLSYTIIGILMGLAGGIIYFGAGEIVTEATLLPGVVGILIGAAIILIGIQYTLGKMSVGLHLPGTDRVMGWLTAWVDRLANSPGIVGLGMVHGILPCPILYPAFLYAFATGSPLAGGLALAALGVGTIPAVFAYGTVIDSVDALHRQRVHRLFGVVFILMGLMLLAHGLEQFGIHVFHPEIPFWDPLGGGHEH